MTHRAAPAFTFSDGPRNARIAFVAEAFGESEQRLGKPLVGAAGQEFNRLLRESGIERSECFLTNVIAARPTPSSNNFDLLCDKKAAVGGRSYTLPMIRQGMYLRPEYFGELERLREELETVRPNLIVALGAKAAWALLSTSGISRIRGTTSPARFVLGTGLVGCKVLPTFHPSYLFQMWSDRPIVLADLAKARREAEFPEFRRPERQVIVSPTLGELREWVTETLAHAPPLLGCDIETVNGQIESIGFARSRRDAIVCPFILREPWRNYWPSTVEELAARELCGALLGSHQIAKLGQNFLYDSQYLLREGFSLRNIAEDTMLLHHSLYLELQKGLGFLGSIYTNEPAWKLMRHRKKDEELKRDE